MFIWNFGKILSEHKVCYAPEDSNLHSRLFVYLKQKEPPRHVFNAMHLMQIQLDLMAQ
jgi:hypothetical protein